MPPGEVRYIEILLHHTKYLRREVVFPEKDFLEVTFLNGFGWYCLFVAITCVPNSGLAFAANDIRFGVMWLVYAFLWFLFWLLTSLKKQIGTFTAWITVIVGVVFVWIPGYLMLVGKW
ncbi:MAG: hypothetical protein IMW94_07685 [Thermoanaerobacter sp.]|nr:hypothetical protein [Thermoanaerobacter sp.]